MVYSFFDKKTSGSNTSAMLANKFASGTVKSKFAQNKESAKKLHKSIIRKFKKRKVHPSFLDNNWGVDLTDMQLKSKFNDGFRFLLCVIDICSKYTSSKYANNL